jgi:NHLM bacteriocin system ABC transporter ATP-binding protein
MMGGEVREIGREPLVLEPGVLWTVRSGEVDLFLASTIEEAPAQARRFVFSRGPGQAFLGIAAQQGRGLVAVATSGATVSRLELAKCTLNESYLSLLEEWIVQFQAAVALGAQPPGRVRRIGSAKLLKVPVEGRMTVGSTEPVVWIPHRTGLWELEGETSTFQLESDFFPLTRNVWLSSCEQAELQPVSTLDWGTKDSRLRDLENFQTLGLERLLAFQEEETQQQCRRLQQKAEQGRSEVSRALHQLASVLDAEETVGVVGGPGSDALRIAFQNVLRNLQVTTSELPVTKGDFSSRVQALSRASRLQTRRIRLRDGWWKRDGGPLLGQLQDSDTPVGIVTGASGGYFLLDPSQNRPVRIDAEVARTLKPDAFAFYRTFPTRVLTLLDILRFGLFKTRADTVTIILTLLAAAGLSTLLPILTGVLFGTIIPQAQPRQILPLILALVVSALASGCFGLTRGLALLRFQGRSMGEVEAAVWDRLLHLPTSFYRKFSAGSLSNRAQALNSILQLITGLAAGAVMGGIVSIANFGLLFYFDHRLALAATALVLVAVIVTFVMGYRNLALGRTLNELESDLNGQVMQLLAGIRKLRAAGAEDRGFAIWARKFGRVRQLEVSQRKISNWLQVFDSVYPMLATMVIYATVAMLGPENIDTATFLAFSAALGSFFSAFLSMGSSGLALLDAIPLYEQARPILQTVPECDLTKLDPGELSGAIEVNHVGFGYTEDGPRVLKDVSFKINPGEYVAVVGPSGAGKSTVARLLLGLETPSCGTISYDGKALEQLDPQALRRRIGVVMQNVQILPGSIVSAIVGNSSATPEDAWEAARMSGLENDLKAMPMGMQTYISEGGGTLSGGQRQRLTIARAIVTRPKILILDEATSALDNESQATVTDSLAQLSATRIVIAHRLSTIRDADRVLVVSGGRIAQQGSFQELAEQPGIFRDLVERQVFA